MKKICLVFIGLFVILLIIGSILALMPKSISLGEKIAVIRIEGPIMDAKHTIDEIKEYARDQSVKAIVLRVDSPGGAVAPSQEIYEEVKKATAKKKIVVSMGSLAASGGYYISAPVSRIFANPGTLTGSIGVIMEIPNIEGLMSKVGVRTEVIKSGRNKDMASAFRSMGKEQRKILQGALDDVHDQFINAVAEGRKMLPSDVRKLADGRIFTGRQALAAGLVDELGDLEDAIKAAAKLGGITGEPDVLSKKDKNSVWDLLRGRFSGEISEIFPSMKMKYMMTP